MPGWSGRYWTNTGTWNTINEWVIIHIVISTFVPEDSHYAADSKIVVCGRIRIRSPCCTGSHNLHNFPIGGVSFLALRHSAPSVLSCVACQLPWQQERRHQCWKLGCSSRWWNSSKDAIPQSPSYLKRSTSRLPTRTAPRTAQRQRWQKPLKT